MGLDECLLDEKFFRNRNLFEILKILKINVLKAIERDIFLGVLGVLGISETPNFDDFWDSIWDIETFWEFSYGGGDVF